MIKSAQFTIYKRVAGKENVLLYTIENQALRVQISDLGAELQSIVCRDAEYLWQGDPAYWGGRSPILFPICGRLTNGTYTYGGKSYAMNPHGLARRLPFSCVEKTDTSIVLRLEADNDTLAIYPFDFVLTVRYALNGQNLDMELTVENRGDSLMPFSVGGHPGFCVPLGDGFSFTDFTVTFPKSEGNVRRCVISERGYLSHTPPQPYLPLTGNCRTLPLTHDLFDCDGVFLEEMGDTVCLSAPGCDRSMTLYFPGMSYLGIWHPPHTDAPFVCLEPWAGMPAYDGEIDDFDTKFAMMKLPSGDSRKFTITFTVT